MISVSKLSKWYGEQKAVDEISFEIKPGEITGFLGPNGAGKSTTMKILTGFLPQTNGQAMVCGIDVAKNPLGVKRLTGYLPEHNPLYTEMFVLEYLEFISQLHHITKPKSRIEEMIELTGLTVERKKKIGQLSKGYRQRVGLAAAMIHNPQVLILDEPTTGLDPNQVLEIRQLIRNVGKDKSVLLSTHIMQEVQAMCSRVIIINKGKLVADDSVEHLKKQGSPGKVFVVEFDKALDKKLILSLPSVASVQLISQTQFRISAVQDIRTLLFEIAVKEKCALISLTEENNSLEQVFANLTQPA